MAPVAKSGYLEKLPSSQIKWGTSGWKKRHLVAKSAGGQARRGLSLPLRAAAYPRHLWPTWGGLLGGRGRRPFGAPVPLLHDARPPLLAQGNMAHPNMVAWHEKEGKPQAGNLVLTPGSTLVVLEPEKGALRAQPLPPLPRRHIGNEIAPAAQRGAPPAFCAQASTCAPTTRNSCTFVCLPAPPIWRPSTR